MKIIDEFKTFALKGNIMDLAIAVIIGTAFGKIVSSLTNDIIMPPLGWIIGGIDFTNLRIALPHHIIGKSDEIVYINYGNFIQSAFDFLIIAFSIFIILKFINKLHHKESAKPIEKAEEPTPSKEELLLTEIRDLLKK